MKALLKIISVCLFLSVSAIVDAQIPGKDVVPPEVILKNINTLLQYYTDHLKLDGDFAAFDTHGQVISKGEFLKQLTTGNYLPLQVYSKNKQWAYRLFRLSSHVDSDAQRMLKQIGDTDYGIYQTIGKPLPAFHYIDLNGNVYTPENTKGKIIVLKAWFISCVPCVKEMPELNQVVDRYKNRKDIIFVSIAFDSKAKLQAFTKRKLFKYAVVPVSADYIENTLHATGYPAHWIINKKGIVVSMSYDSETMIAALDKEASDNVRK